MTNKQRRVGGRMKSLLDPKVDFIFKKIFGNEKHPKILISFLNSVIQPENKIVAVRLKDTEITKDNLEDKFSRLDVKATTSNGEHVNIEIQLKNEYNMIKRTLYYWGRMYSEQLGEGENYNQLSRTICINILNFKYLAGVNFHSAYRLKERTTNVELTDIQEIHFIEIPKLPKEAEIKDVLAGWVEFLRDPNSEKTLGLEMNIEEILEAKKELIRLSNDITERERYDQREKSNKDRTSALEKALSEGIDQGIEQGLELGMISVAKKLKATGSSIDLIELATGLTRDQIESL